MDRTKAFGIRAVVAGILFAIYLFICKAANIDKKVMSEVGLFCISIAAIVTPLYYYAVIKLLKLDYEDISNFFGVKQLSFL